MIEAWALSGTIRAGKRAREGAQVVMLESGATFLKGRIDPAWTKANPDRAPVYIDGEVDANGNLTHTVRTLPHCLHYTPQPGDLVMIISYNHSMIIFDKITGI